MLSSHCHVLPSRLLCPRSGRAQHLSAPPLRMLATTSASTLHPRASTFAAPPPLPAHWPGTRQPATGAGCTACAPQNRVYSARGPPAPPPQAVAPRRMIAAPLPAGQQPSLPGDGEGPVITISDAVVSLGLRRGVAKLALLPSPARLHGSLPHCRAAFPASFPATCHRPSGASS